MIARKIRESYDGGSIEVGADPARYSCPVVPGRIRLDVTERALGEAVLHLTAGEIGELIAGLVSAVSDLDGLHPYEVLRDLASATLRPQDTRSGDVVQLSTSPADENTPADVAGDRGAGHTALTVADALRRARAELLANSTPVHVHEEWTECRHRGGQCCSACHVDSAGDFAPPATSILSGLSIAEVTAARLAADPASAEVPFEAGGALHVVERCGCSDCEDGFANSTPVGGEVR